MKYNHFINKIGKLHRLIKYIFIESKFPVCYTIKNLFFGKRRGFPISFMMNYNLLSDIKDFLSVEEYLNKCVKLKVINNPLIANAKTSLKNAVVDYFLCLKQDLSLSIRDIDTLVKNYNILLDTSLKGVDNIGPLLIYLFLLALKYKYPNIYGTLLGDATEKEKNDTYRNSPINNALCTSYNYVKYAISAIKTNKIMALREHCVSHNGAENMESHFDALSYNNEVLTVFENGFPRLLSVRFTLVLCFGDKGKYSGLKG